MADAGQQSVIYCRMTERAGNADADDLSSDDLRFHANDGVLPQQLSGTARPEGIVQEKLDKIQPAEIDLESQAKRGEWPDSFLDDFVQFGGIGPVRLVAECVVAKNFAALALEVVAGFGFRKLPARAEEQDRNERPITQSRDGV